MIQMMVQQGRGMKEVIEEPFKFTIESFNSTSSGLGLSNALEAEGYTWSIVSSDPSWLYSTINSGTGTTNINIYMIQNNTTEPREGTLTATTSGGKVAVFTATMDGKSVDFRFTSNGLVTSAAAKSRTNLLHAEGVNWEITSNQPWLTALPNVGHGTTDITVTMTENPNPITSRSGIITATSGEHITQYQVTQDKNLFAFSPNSATLPAYGNQGTNVRLYASGISWTIEIDDPWISVNKTSGTGTEFNVGVTVSRYYDTENDRVGYFRAKSAGRPDAVVKVTQSKA